MEKKNFSYSQPTTADLLLKAELIAAGLRRDVNELSRYGITEDVISLFEKQISITAHTGTEAVWQGEKQVATLQKAGARTELINALCRVNALMLQHYGTFHAVGEQYDLRGLSVMRTGLLATVADRFIDAVQQRIGELDRTANGSEWFNELCNARDNFKAAISQHNQSLIQSRKATEMRRQSIKELRATMSRLSAIARIHWRIMHDNRLYDYRIQSRSRIKTSPPIPVANTQLQYPEQLRQAS